VLENFHLATLIQLLHRNGLGHLLSDDCGSPSGPCFWDPSHPFFLTHPPPSNTEFRRILVASVLATDMSRHFIFVRELEDRARTRAASGRPLAPLSTSPAPGPFSALNVDTVKGEDEEAERDRLLLCCSLIKSADISNPARTHTVSKAWSSALLDEWAEQAKLEAEFELPVSVLTVPVPTATSSPSPVSRAVTSQALHERNKREAQARSQLDFIYKFVQPLFDALTALCPGRSSAPPPPILGVLGAAADFCIACRFFRVF
jgi:hypothetical protein